MTKDKIVAFRGAELIKSDVDVLRELESLTGVKFSKSIDYVDFTEFTCALNRVSQLGIYKCNIKTLPKSIGDLKSLEVLKLTGNAIINLPESIGNLKSLRYLSIKHNNLSSLPVSIGDLKSLKSLSIVGNGHLTTIPESIGNLKSLTYLELYNNNLKNLPDSIINLTSLKTLDIMKNPISISYSTLPESVKKLEKRGVYIER